MPTDFLAGSIPRNLPPRAQTAAQPSSAFFLPVLQTTPAGTLQPRTPAPPLASPSTSSVLLQSAVSTGLSCRPLQTPHSPVPSLNAHTASPCVSPQTTRSNIPGSPATRPDTPPPPPSIRTSWCLAKYPFAPAPRLPLPALLQTHFVKPIEPAPNPGLHPTPPLAVQTALSDSHVRSASFRAPAAATPENSDYPASPSATLARSRNIQSSLPTPAGPASRSPSPQPHPAPLCIATTAPATLLAAP